MTLHAVDELEVAGTGDEVAERLRAVGRRMAERSGRLLGYPESQRFDHAPLAPLLAYNIDNLGDPYSDLLYGVMDPRVKQA